MPAVKKIKEANKKTNKNVIAYSSAIRSHARTEKDEKKGKLGPTFKWLLVYFPETTQHLFRQTFLCGSILL